MTPQVRAKVEDDLHRMLGRHSGVLSLWVANFNSASVDGPGLRHDVNVFLRLQLGALAQSTIDARLCLSDECDYRRWLTMLERHVLPIMVTHRLPVPYAALVSCLASD